MYRHSNLIKWKSYSHRLLFYTLKAMLERKKSKSSLSFKYIEFSKCIHSPTIPTIIHLLFSHIRKHIGYCTGEHICNKRLRVWYLGGPNFYIMRGSCPLWSSYQRTTKSHYQKMQTHSWCFKFIIFYWVAFKTILECMQPTGHGLATSER